MTKLTVSDLAARVFAARDAAHRAHWRTGSYARHMALGDFYESVIESIDEIVEVEQGLVGALIQPFTVTDPQEDNIVTLLESDVKWIEQSREEIAHGSTAIQNLIDGLTAIYSRALYKLKFLN